MTYENRAHQRHFTVHCLQWSITSLTEYIYIVNTKYQKLSVKALVQVDFPVYAQVKTLFKSKQEKNGTFHKAVISSWTDGQMDTWME